MTQTEPTPRKRPSATRIVLLGVVMAAIIIGLAFPNLFTRSDDTSPRAMACRAEAVEKFPPKMEEIQNTGNGTGRVMINRNSKAYSDAYTACMDR
jgi:hypothetical protein